MSTHVMTVRAVTKVGVDDMAGDAYVEAGNIATDFYIPNDGRTVLIIDAVTGDTWVFTPVPDKYGRTESRSFVVGAGDWGIIGPFLPELWNDVDGYVHFSPNTGNVGDLLLAVRVANPT